MLKSGCLRSLGHPLSLALQKFRLGAVGRWMEFSNASRSPSCSSGQHCAPAGPGGWLSGCLLGSSLAGFAGEGAASFPAVLLGCLLRGGSWRVPGWRAGWPLRQTPAPL